MTRRFGEPVLPIPSGDKPDYHRWVRRLHRFHITLNGWWTIPQNVDAEMRQSLAERMKWSTHAAYRYKLQGLGYA